LSTLPPSASTKLQSAVFALLAALTVASLAGTALAPYLLVKSPLLLVAISAAAHHVALAAATVDPLPLVAVATLRRVLTGLGAYGLGYLYGPRALAWVERLFARFGVLVLVVAPAPTVALLAGSARSRLPAFLIALTVGHLLWNTATFYLGDAFARWTDVLTASLGENLLESTLVCVLLVTLQQGIAHLRRRRQRAAT
jgi:membrane protein DedA with SNARE-associated domain